MDVLQMDCKNRESFLPPGTVVQAAQFELPCHLFWQGGHHEPTGTNHTPAQANPASFPKGVRPGRQGQEPAGVGQCQMSGLLPLATVGGSGLPGFIVSTVGSPALSDCHRISKKAHRGVVCEIKKGQGSLHRGRKEK